MKSTTLHLPRKSGVMRSLIVSDKYVSYQPTQKGAKLTNQLFGVFNFLKDRAKKLV